MWLGAGDFDIEDRVSASEGVSVIPSASFGNYDEDVYGEIESYDVLSMGDFEDSEPMGWRPKFKKPKLPKKPSIKQLKKMHPAASLKQIQKIQHQQVKAAQQASRSTMPRKAFGKRFMPKFAAPKAYMPKPGFPKVNIPRPTVPKMTMPSVRSAVAAAAIRKTGGVQSVVSNISKGMKFRPTKKQAMARPVSPKIEVVAAAGQPLNVSDVAPVSQVMAAGVKASRSPYAHPLLAVSSGMGYYDEAMGFDLKSFLSKAKTDAQAALKKAVSDAQVKAKEAASSFLAKQSSKIIADPKVQALAKEEAEKAATSALAERLRSPETKAMAMNAGKVVLGLGAAYIAYTMYKKSQLA